MKLFAPFEREDRIRELSKYFASEYVKLAFNLPPTSGSFWCLVEEDIDVLASEDTQPFSNDVNQMLAFLARFFSTSLLDMISANLDALDNSFLGIEYTLREGKAMVALNILRDIQDISDVEGSPLQNFFGHVPIDGEEDFHGRDEIQTETCAHFESEGGIVRSGGGGAGVRGRDREDRGEAFLERHFDNLDEQCILIPLPSFSVPPRGDHCRSRILKHRSSQFVFDDRVGDQREMLYNPHNSQSRKVLLYHGTRSSSLSQFKKRGIDPPPRRNEFSRDTAFYVSNSIRHAYEHPMHTHPARCIADPICVLVFELDASVLNGLKPPQGETSSLTVLWFLDTQEKTPAWQDFCKGNFKGTARHHHYDIVIGPVCLPRDEGDWLKQHIDMAYSTPLTQVAFCSPRAREWLGSSFKVAYLETFTD